MDKFIIPHSFKSQHSIKSMPWKTKYLQWFHSNNCQIQHISSCSKCIFYYFFTTRMDQNTKILPKRMSIHKSLLSSKKFAEYCFLHRWCQQLTIFHNQFMTPLKEGPFLEFLRITFPMFHWCLFIEFHVFFDRFHTKKYCFKWALRAIRS